jgi:hypothetical protein
MSPGIDILEGISQRIRDAVGPEASNRGSEGDTSADATDSSAAEPDSPDEDADDDETGGESVTADDDRATSDYDAPACCSAASNTDVSVLDE